MQLTIIAPKSAATATTDIKWISKGGSSIVSEDGRWSLRRNSKGAWKVLDNGNELAGGLTKEEAKAEAVQAVALAGTDVKSALQDGSAHVYSVRADGTTRRRHYLTGADLVSAQEVRKLREDGEGMAKIAGKLHVSVSAVRRILVDLAITEELSEMEADELAAMLSGAKEAE